MGYQITSPEGKNLFYTGDTGNGLEDCWQHINPDLLVVEVTAADKYVNSAKDVRHLTPLLLKEELASFRKIKGYLPKIITVHMFPKNPEKEQIDAALKRVSAELNTPIIPGYEGLQITL